MTSPARALFQAMRPKSRKGPALPIDLPKAPKPREDRDPLDFNPTPHEDHDELLAFLKDLKGKVVLCGYPSEKYDTALEGWRRVTKTAWADGVNCSKQRTEVLWMNFEDQEPGLFGAMQVAA